MRFRKPIAAVVAATGLLAAGLMAVSPGTAAESKQPAYFEHTLTCLKLLFEDLAAHAQECPGQPAIDLKSLAPTGNGSDRYDCGPVFGIATSVEGVPSDPCVKQQVSYLTETDGLRFYRFQYLGDEHYYYGVMARELLADPRYASAVHLSAGGYYTVDYDMLGLDVPEEAAMRTAGLRAMKLAAALYL